MGKDGGLGEGKPFSPSKRVSFPHTLCCNQAGLSSNTICARGSSHFGMDMVESTYAPRRSPGSIQKGGVRLDMKRFRLSSGVLGRMLSFSSLYSYIYCILVSQALVMRPLLGGALYMLCEIGTVFFTTYAGARRFLLPVGLRRAHTAVLAAFMVLALTMVIVYPFRFANDSLWVLFALAIAMLIRDGFGMRLLRAWAEGRLKTAAFAGLMTLTHLLPAAAMMVLFLTALPAGLNPWMLLGGYLLCDLLSTYGQWKEVDDLRSLSREQPRPEQLSRLAEALRQANAFRVYEVLSSLIVIAQSVTTVLLYTYLTVAGGERLLISLGIAVGVAALFREAAERWMAWRQARRGERFDPTNILLTGLFLWLFGLAVFHHAAGLTPPDMVNVYISLGLCTGGSTLCITCLDFLEGEMEQVARFTAGQDITGYRSMRTASLKLAGLIGQMAALILLALLCFLLPSGGVLVWTAPEEARIQPILILPALLAVLAALVFTFRFPLSVNTLDKLARFLHLQEEGGSNATLEEQLQQKVIGKHRQPFGTRALKAVIRTLYRHELRGAENIRAESANPIVFLCNHGEMYGPVVSVCYLPVAVRSWSIDKVMGDVDEVTAYIYKYTFSQVKWLPPPLRHPVARLAARLLCWCLRQLESIPVYRDSPGRLMKTFRASVEALQAGDNLLIFPENPNAEGEDHGYEASGLGEFFSGFTMLAPLYWRRTGKRCRFLPMYANKQSRVIAIGTEIVWDPDADSHDETERIVREAREQMTRMMEETGETGEKGRKPRG